MLSKFGLDSERLASMDLIHEGKRKYPRVELDLPIEIQMDGKKVLSQVHNISLDGIQIRCDKETAEGLYPVDQATQIDDGPTAKVSFPLPIAGDQHVVKACCKFYYVTFIDEQSTAFGLIFRGFEDNSGKTVETFLIESIEKYN